MLQHSGYHGLDVSAAAIEIARRKASGLSHAPMTYEAGDVHEWPLPPDPFGLVVCVDAVAYFRDQGLVLKKIARVLQPAGKLVMTTINPFVYHRIRSTAQSPLREGSVSRWLSRRELHALIQSRGFAIEHSWTIMPRGNQGILRLINARRIDAAAGARGASILKDWKERAGLGQYRIVIARKNG
jgi:SAM-dependent methyltransferase